MSRAAKLYLATAVLTTRGVNTKSGDKSHSDLSGFKNLTEFFYGVIYVMQLEELLITGMMNNSSVPGDGEKGSSTVDNAKNKLCEHTGGRWAGPCSAWQYVVTK